MVDKTLGAGYDKKNDQVYDDYMYLPLYRIRQYITIQYSNGYFY